MHRLLLDIKDSTVNNKYLYVQDLSEWDSMLPIRHKRLQILPPYMDSYLIVPIPENGPQFALTSRSLNLSTSLDDLPDGLYRVHYSVSPNDRVYHEFGHYRIAKLMNSVLGKMAGITYADTDIDQCGNIKLSKHENTLIHIWMLLKGAQQTGYDLNACAKADELYKQAMREYDKLFELNCGNC